MDYVLAQVNVGRLVAPLDSPRLAGFVAALDPLNAVADAAPGFVWRLQTEDGNATAIRAFERDAEGADGGILINMSVWESVEALGAYVYGAAHVAVLRQRREWFERMKEAYTALWWIPRGHIPAVHEAEDRVRHLRAHGPTPYAFTLREHFPPPDSGDTGLLRSPEDWTCPALPLARAEPSHRAGRPAGKVMSISLMWPPKSRLLLVMKAGRGVR